MNSEKILIESKKCNVSSISSGVFAIFLIRAVVMLVSSYDSLTTEFENHVHGVRCYRDSMIYSDFQLHAPNCRFSYFKTAEDYAIQMFTETTVPNFYLILGVGAAASIIVFLIFNFTKVTVSNTRIFGRSFFGIPVNQPIDSVTSVVKFKFLKTVVVSSSSRKSVFMLIKNFDEVYGEINNFLIERQKNKKTVSLIKNEEKSESYDDLAKLKNLLDQGAITQEEFDAKKKQILGL